MLRLGLPLAVLALHLSACGFSGPDCASELDNASGGYAGTCGFRPDPGDDGAGDDGSGDCAETYPELMELHRQ